MVVHRDRDYLSDEEVHKFEEKLRQHDIQPFVTGPSDIEGYYLSVDHICKQHPTLERERVTEIVRQACSESRDLSVKDIINLRTEHAFGRRKSGESVNVGAIAVQAQNDYDSAPVSMARGKIVLGTLKALLQKELGSNSALIAPSAHIDEPRLRAIAEAIWPQATRADPASRSPARPDEVRHRGTEQDRVPG
jgi:hypothetical protein